MSAQSDVVGRVSNVSGDRAKFRGLVRTQSMGAVASTREPEPLCLGVADRGSEALTLSEEEPAEFHLFVACAVEWAGECLAWGTVYAVPHGCKLRPGHTGQHTCACSTRYYGSETQTT